MLLLANGALLLTGLRGRKIEKKVQALPTTDESLAAEYKRVCNSWMRKALPDF